MKQLLKVSVMIILFSFLLVGCDNSKTEASTASESKVTVEGVEEIGTKGIKQIIEQSKGKVVFINFWATWCPPCRKEIPDLMNVRKSYSDDELVLIGVSVDSSKDDLIKFMEKTNFNYPIYLATEEVGRDFQLKSIPRTIIINKKGEVALDEVGAYTESAFKTVIDKLRSE